MEQSKDDNNNNNNNNNNSNSNGNGNGNGNIEHNNSIVDDVPLDVDVGDPVMYYSYWKSVDDECSVTIKASEHLSYFANHDPDEYPYHVPGFTKAIKRVHRVIGNAVTEGRHIIGGTGSSQLFNYLLRALSAKAHSGATKPNKRVPVINPAPYYGLFAASVEIEQAGMYEWRGDPEGYDEDGPYIEVVTTPNNPDGLLRKPMVNREGGLLIHDLAYYWPQYTPIRGPADYDIMLFTLSKFTGHAGSRIGWAIVKDPEIAKMMEDQLFFRSVGCCHEGQVRATRILNFISDSCEKIPIPGVPSKMETLFEFGCRVMAERWKKVRAVLKRNEDIFNLFDDYPPQYCNFFRTYRSTTPAFAWLESKIDVDASELMSELKIKARNGAMFGSKRHKKYVRLTLFGWDDEFDLLIQRLSSRPASVPIDGISSASKLDYINGN